LPSATLGKGFAEGIIAFTECIRHSAKRLNPVVPCVEREQEINKLALGLIGWIQHIEGFVREKKKIHACVCEGKKEEKSMHHA
jgi:hypothetical protein